MESAARRLGSIGCARTLCVATSTAFATAVLEVAMPYEMTPRPPSSTGFSAYARVTRSRSPSRIALWRLPTSQPSSSLNWIVFERRAFASSVFTSVDIGTRWCSKKPSTRSPFLYRKRPEMPM